MPILNGVSKHQPIYQPRTREIIGPEIIESGLWGDKNTIVILTEYWQFRFKIVSVLRFYTGILSLTGFVVGVLK